MKPISTAYTLSSLNHKSDLTLDILEYKKVLLRDIQFKEQRLSELKEALEYLDNRNPDCAILLTDSSNNYNHVDIDGNEYEFMVAHGVPCLIDKNLKVLRLTGYIELSSVESNVAGNKVLKLVSIEEV